MAETARRRPGIGTALAAWAVAVATGGLTLAVPAFVMALFGGDPQEIAAALSLFFVAAVLGAAPAALGVALLLAVSARTGRAPIAAAAGAGYALIAATAAWVAPEISALRVGVIGAVAGTAAALFVRRRLRPAPEARP